MQNSEHAEQRPCRTEFDDELCTDLALSYSTMVPISLFISRYGLNLNVDPEKNAVGGNADWDLYFIYYKCHRSWLLAVDYHLVGFFLSPPPFSHAFILQVL